MAKLLLSVVIVIGGAWWFLDGRNSFSSTPDPATDKVKESSDQLVVVEDDWIKGNKDAQVTLIEYLDFECEACGAYYPIVKELEKKFEGKLRVVTRYFPLPGHKNSMEAALAAEAAGRQGKYFEMHDLLFGSQKEWAEKSTADPNLFLPYAEKLGLNMEKFNQDRKDPTVMARVEKNKAEANKLKLSGTPSFFLNGRTIKSPRTSEDFQSLIQMEIDKLSAK